MNIYPNINKQEIERQYFLRGLRPDYDVTVISDWVERSGQFIKSNPGSLDIKYGPVQRNKLDFFPAKGNNGNFVLYIHGGYWQRGDKSIYRFLAEPFLDKGISVALLNYPMCPEIKLSKIADHVRLAIYWLWQHADKLSFSREKFNIIGHSAGGHLTSEMILTDWNTYNKHLPSQLIRSGIALSGLYDLKPLLHCSENERLKLDNEEVILASPINRESLSIAPMLIGYGVNEPDDMHRQSTDFYNKFRRRCKGMECHIIPEADHFDVVNVLGDKGSDLFKNILRFIINK